MPGIPAPVQDCPHPRPGNLHLSSWHSPALSCHISHIEEVLSTSIVVVLHDNTALPWHLPSAAETESFGGPRARDPGPPCRIAHTPAPETCICRHSTAPCLYLLWPAETESFGGPRAKKQWALPRFRPPGTREVSIRGAVQPTRKMRRGITHSDCPSRSRPAELQSLP